MRVNGLGYSYDPSLDVTELDRCGGGNGGDRMPDW